MVKNKLRTQNGRFKKGNEGFWKGKERTLEDKLKMSKPKKTKYIELGKKDICKFCNTEFLKSIHNQIYCKTCCPQIEHSHLIRNYNISYPQYLEMIEKCSGKCEICLIEKATDIDHDHKTGKVRGILCHNCNLILGHAKDKIEILDRSIEYLKRNSYGR